MSLLIKQSPLVNELSLYDVVNTPGVAADLSHCSTPATVRSTVGMGNAAEALTGRGKHRWCSSKLTREHGCTDN